MMSRPYKGYAAHPMEKNTFRPWVCFKRVECQLILALYRHGLLNTCQVRFDLRQYLLSDFHPKYYSRQRKEAVTLVLHHSLEYGMDQRIIGIEQDIVGLKAVEHKGKMKGLKATA